MLIVAPVVLLVLTVFGMSGLQTASSQQRMAAAFHDRDVAFLAAEAALVEGEALVRTLTLEDLSRFERNAHGLYRLVTDPSESDLWERVDWEHDAGLRTLSVALDGVVLEPRYMVEYVEALRAGSDTLNLSNVGAPPGSPTHVFRVTARARGRTAASVVLLQSVYGAVL